MYNPAPRITPPPKHIWTFYDQEMAFWNHYGELELFTAKDEPTNVTRPTLIRYKGKIYPGNRVHSAWIGFEETGKPGLGQIFMKDFFPMWNLHRADPAGTYPELARITDDNQDGVIEVNRAEEIDVLLAATTAHLAATGFPMEERRLVWVSDSRAHDSSGESRQLPRETHEATAYASVYKFSHDIAPARAAVGSGGCTDCHHSGSDFLHGPVLLSPFSGENAAPVWAEAHEILAIPAWSVRLGEIREATVKPALYLLLGLNLVILGVLAVTRAFTRRGIVDPRGYRRWLLLAAAIVAGALVVRRPGLMDYMILDRFALDAKHFWVALGAIGLGTAVALEAQVRRGNGNRSAVAVILAVLICLSGVSGALMLLDLRWTGPAIRLAYSVFDIALALVAAVAALGLLGILADRPSTGSGGPKPEQSATRRASTRRPTMTGAGS